MRSAGVDPGLSGCLCLNDGSGLAFFDKYILKINGKKEYNIALMVQILKDIQPDFVVIERQQAMPKQGVSSTFKTGLGYGIWLGILSALSIPFEVVQARAWQKEMFQGNAHTDTKELSFKIASQLYPKNAQDMQGPRGGLLDGRADAAMICEYGIRKDLKSGKKI